MLKLSLVCVDASTSSYIRVLFGFWEKECRPNDSADISYLLSEKTFSPI